MQESIQPHLPPQRSVPESAIPAVDIAQRDSDISNKPSRHLLTPSDWNIVGWIGFGIIVLIGSWLQYALTAAFAATLFLFALIWWRTGFFTWRRVALRPAKFYARGQHERAEEYYLRARKYAETKFRTDDFRRGLMMTALGDFAAQTARPGLAEELYHAGLRVLCRLIENHPNEYFLCVNNYAAMHVNWKNYDKAQAILELAAETVRPYSEHQRSKTGMIPMVIRYNLALVCALLKQTEAAEGHLARIDPAAFGWLNVQRSLASELVVVVRARLCCMRGAYEDALHDCSKIKRLSKMAALSRCLALMGLNRHAEAEAAALQALEANKHLAPTHPNHLDFQFVLVECALAQREWRQAQRWRDKALETATAANLLGHAFWTDAQMSWRGLLEKAGNHELAAAWRLTQAPAMQSGPETAIRELAAD